MMRKFISLGYRLPKVISIPLFGDREKYGLQTDFDDVMFQKWQILETEIHTECQRKGIGKIVNDSGYAILSEIDFSSKNVLEIGVGNLDHIDLLKGTPNKYFLVDQNQTYLDRAAIKLSQKNIPFEKILVSKKESDLSFLKNKIDIIISFYSLEHLYPLCLYLKQFYDILKDSGLLVGAIPTEGGLAWGLGRFFTTRRYFQKRGLDLNKLICWEHPNFADFILNNIQKYFKISIISFYPFYIPVIDLNLTIRFICQKNKEYLD